MQIRYTDSDTSTEVKRSHVWTLVLAPLTFFASANPCLGQDRPSNGECYDTQLGAWSLADTGFVSPELRGLSPSETADSVEYSIPSRVRFTNDPHPLHQSLGYVLETPEDVLPVPHSMTTWRELGDSLAVTFSTGYVGTTAVLLPTSQGWVGQQKTFTDTAGGPRYTRTLRLVPTQCDSPPPVPVSLLRALPQSVELDEARPLTLGAPVPAGLDRIARRSRQAKRIVAATVGFFAGTDSVVVVTAPGREVVGTIQLKYAPEFSWEDLLRRVEASWGPANHRGDSGSAWWTSRTTVVMIVPSTSGWTRVVLRDRRLGF